MRPIRRLTGLLRHFATDSSGAVTVDYVVLTAAITSLGLGVLASVRSGTEAMSAQIELDLSSTARFLSGVNRGWQGGGVPVGYTPDPPSDADFDPEPVYEEPPSNDGDQDSGVTPDDTGGQPDDLPPNGDGPDQLPPDTLPDIPPDPPANGQGGSGGRGAQNPAPDTTDFSFEDLYIGCNWSDRAVSQWLTLNLAQDTPFQVYGDGNPVAHVENGNASAAGMLRWGTNIQVDIPPPGTSRTVYMELGEDLGSFTLHRAACP